MANRVSGIISFKVDGEVYNAKGSFTLNYGFETREAIIGSDTIHGYKAMPVAPGIQGAITDDGNLDIQKLANITDSTITVQQANGKIFVLRNAWHTNPDGLGITTEESEVAVAFQGKSAEDVKV